MNDKFQLTFTTEELELIEAALDEYNGPTGSCDENNYTACELQQRIANILYAATEARIDQG